MFFMPGEFEVQEATTREKITRVGRERTAIPMILITLGGSGIVSNISFLLRSCVGL